MAKCQKCGTKIGFGQDMCDSCRQKLQQQKAQEEQHKRQVAQQQYDTKIAEFVDYIHDTIRSRVENGDEAYIYKYLHVDIDSMIEDPHDPTGIDLYDLSTSGAQGWELIAGIDRTYSGSQSYVSKNKITATSWGGGSTTQRVSLSGNIVGSYLIFRLTITQANFATNEQLIKDNATATIVSKLGPRPR